MAKVTAMPSYRADEDHLGYWINEYMRFLEDDGAGELQKTRRMLMRFVVYMQQRYDGNDQVSILVPRDIKAYLAWLQEKKEVGGCNYSPSYVNSHQVALGQYVKWLMIRRPNLLQSNPMKGITMVRAQPETEAKSLTPKQIVSLKNTVERLPALQKRSNSRPFRDRAIVYVFLSTGLRRHELVGVDLLQLVPSDIKALRASRRAKIVRVRGKRKTERTVYLSAEARSALADYLEFERPLDETPGTRALFLSTGSSEDRRLHVRSINKILEPIGISHDATFRSPDCKLSRLAPHDLRHTSASELRRSNPEMTDEDLMIYMGWSDKEQLLRYTKAQEEVIIEFVEKASKGRQ